MVAAAGVADAAGVLENNAFAVVLVSVSEAEGSSGAGAGAGVAAGAPNLCHDTPQRGKEARRAMRKTVWNKFAQRKHIQ